MLQALMKSLHCYEPSQHQAKLAPLLLTLTTRESYSESDQLSSINLHGALILQELLNFSKPIKVVSSLLACQAPFLRSILVDPRGSHVTDTFMNRYCPLILSKLQICYK